MLSARRKECRKTAQWPHLLPSQSLADNPDRIPVMHVQDSLPCLSVQQGHPAQEQGMQRWMQQVLLQCVTAQTLPTGWWPPRSNEQCQREQVSALPAQQLRASFPAPAAEPRKGSQGSPVQGERRQGEDREQLWESLSTARPQRGPLRVGQGNGVGGRGWRKAVPAASSPSCPCGWELCSPGSGRRAAAPCHSSGAD